MSIALVGCGAAGTLVCLELLKQGIPPEKITIIDPFFDGGALGRQWGAIYSNTRWEQIRASMADYPSSQKALTELDQKYKGDDRTILSDLAWLLQESLRPLLNDFNIYVDACRGLQATDSGWCVKLTENTPTPTASQANKLFEKVFLCPGGAPNYLDLGKPQIPLEIALDSARLSRIVRPNQTVAVFGLAHSGTLICKHLLALNTHVYGIYNREKPFLFSRDGEYDGIKQESAEIADWLLTSPPRFEMLRFQDTIKLLKALSKVHWIVCATGFHASPIQILNKEGQSISSSDYDPSTGQLHPSLFGFGLAFPGVTNVNGKVYKDVSIPSFVEQIRRCLPSILSKS